MTKAFIFPGQGSQFIGMGKDLAENFSVSRETFDEVDEALGQKLSAMMFEGNETDLNLTENTQPALMAMSVAVVRAISNELGHCVLKDGSFIAGHSLGEYSALTAAGSFDLGTAAKILKLRGQAMQRAVPIGEGAMAAIIGMSFEEVEAIATEAGCSVANDNSVGQVVVSGSASSVDTAMEMAKEQGAKMAVKLAVSAPFHCPMMAPAAAEMRDALAKITLNSPSTPLITNVTADVETDPEAIRALLVEQVTGKVRWRESVIAMADKGVTEMVELGAGKVLSGLTRRIDKSIATSPIGTVDQIKAYVESQG